MNRGLERGKGREGETGVRNMESGGGPGVCDSLQIQQGWCIGFFITRRKSTWHLMSFHTLSVSVMKTMTHYVKKKDTQFSIL